MMLYAKVVLGIPVVGSFDYYVPEKFSDRVKLGVRTEVDFNQQRKIAYIVGLKKQSKIKTPKPILKLIDTEPVLDKDLLLLTQRVAQYYACSWGQAIESALPSKLPPLFKTSSKKEKYINLRTSIQLLQGLYFEERFNFYIEEINKTIRENKSVLFLLPEFNLLSSLSQKISQMLNLEPIILSRKKTQDIKNWYRLFNLEKPTLVMGLRSAIFAPLNNLGLIIIEDEPNPAYKNMQTPYYHTRDVAIMRAEIEKIKLIMGASLLSLESFSLIKKKKFLYLSLSSKNRELPEIKIITSQRSFIPKSPILSVYIQDQINHALQQKERVLLFLNRRGFATFVFCQTCNSILKCPRCNVNLVYHFEEKILACNYCNFKQDSPEVCPICNCGYIKYKGRGIEKVENQLSCLYPNLKIGRYDKKTKAQDSTIDIYVATRALINRLDLRFSLVIILEIERFINQMDFRSEENLLYLITKILELTDKKLIIESISPKYLSLQAIFKQDFNLFYEEELRKRKEVGFPPFKHLILIKLRGKNHKKVMEKTKLLFEILTRYNRDKNTEIFSYGKPKPEKLRDNYYAQVIIKTKDVLTTNRFIIKHLKKLSRSGIIVTIDVDPIF